MENRRTPDKDLPFSSNLNTSGGTLSVCSPSIALLQSLVAFPVKFLTDLARSLFPPSLLSLAQPSAYSPQDNSPHHLQSTRQFRTFQQQHLFIPFHRPSSLTLYSHPFKPRTPSTTTFKRAGRTSSSDFLLPPFRLYLCFRPHQWSPAHYIALHRIHSVIDDCLRTLLLRSFTGDIHPRLYQPKMGCSLRPLLF